MTENSAQSSPRRERDEVFDGALEAWGADSQIDLAIEELGELITELARVQNGRESASEEAVVDEVADCRIALTQLTRIFDPDAIQEREAQKMRRLDRRVSEAGGYDG